MTLDATAWVTQPVHSVMTNLTASGLNKFASRQWSVAAKQLKQVLDKVMIVAEDNGQMTRDAVQQYSTSCTFTRHSSSLSLCLSLCLCVYVYAKFGNSGITGGFSPYG